MKYSTIDISANTRGDLKDPVQGMAPVYSDILFWIEPDTGWFEIWETELNLTDLACARLASHTLITDTHQIFEHTGFRAKRCLIFSDPAWIYQIQNIRLLSDSESETDNATGI